MKNQKGISLITIIIIIAIILFFIFIMSGSSSKYELTANEAVSLATLRTAVFQSAVDGTGTLTTEHFNTLGKLVKNANSTNQWFSGNKAIYYGKATDTSNQEITILSDGDYIAKFTVEIENPESFTNKKTYLVNYSFEEGTIQANSISIID